MKNLTPAPISGRRARLRRIGPLGVAAAALYGALLAPATMRPASADAIGDAMNSTVTTVAPSIVSLRVIDTVTRKESGQSANQDVTVVFKGVVVSADGLIMCTNSYISTAAVEGALGIPADATDSGISVVPQEIRITVGDEATEYYGTVAARDDTLGLAFVQIRDLNGRQLPFVDLSAPSAAAPAIGDATESITRLDKDHDYAPFAVVARVVGTITKPRRAYLTDSDSGALGLPVYADGALLGVSSYFSPGERTADDLFTDRLARLFDDYANVAQQQFIIPVANVAPLIDLAKKQAADLPPFIVPKPRPTASSTTSTATPSVKPGAAPAPLPSQKPAAPVAPATLPTAPASK